MDSLEAVLGLGSNDDIIRASSSKSRLVQRYIDLLLDGGNTDMNRAHFILAYNGMPVPERLPLEHDTDTARAYDKLMVPYENQVMRAAVYSGFSAVQRRNPIMMLMSKVHDFTQVPHHESLKALSRVYWGEGCYGSRPFSWDDVWEETRGRLERIAERMDIPPDSEEGKLIVVGVLKRLQPAMSAAMILRFGLIDGRYRTSRQVAEMLGRDSLSFDVSYHQLKTNYELMHVRDWLVQL